MTSIFTSDELDALSIEIDQQLQELRSIPSDLKAGEEPSTDLVLAKQSQTIQQVTQEPSASFLRKFGRAAKSDLCEEGGMLNQQWKKWGDLDNKDAVERLGAVLLAMGFTGGVLRSLVVAITVIVIHIGVKAFCEDYSHPSHPSPNP